MQKQELEIFRIGWWLFTLSCNGRGYLYIHGRDTRTDVTFLSYARSFDQGDTWQITGSRGKIIIPSFSGSKIKAAEALLTYELDRGDG